MNVSFGTYRWLLIASLALSPVLGTAQETAPLPRPLTIEAAVAYAAEHNPGLLRTRERIREQEGVLIQARASQLPSVAASGKYTKMDDGLLESSLYENRSWTVDITARQVLYAGGGTMARVRGERERLEAARLSFDVALNDTIFALRTQFHQVLLNREIIAVHEEALRVLETALKQARDRREVGAGSDFDVLRAEVAVANEKPALIRARNAYRVAQDQLRVTLGAPAVDDNALSDLDVQGTLSASRQEITLAAALSAARTRRPELAQQARLISAAEQGVKGARAGYLPSVSAVAGYEWTSTSTKASKESSLDGWIAGVQGSWAIFDGRSTAAQVRQGQSRVRQAQLAETELQLAVDLDVRQAYSALIEAEELLASSEKVVDQARESLRLAEVRSKAGTATQLDVLQAQSALTSARSNLAQAQYAHGVAVTRITRAMGTPLYATAADGRR